MNVLLDRMLDILNVIVDKHQQLQHRLQNLVTQLTPVEYSVDWNDFGVNVMIMYISENVAKKYENFIVKVKIYQIDDTRQFEDETAFRNKLENIEYQYEYKFLQFFTSTNQNYADHINSVRNLNAQDGKSYQNSATDENVNGIYHENYKIYTTDGCNILANSSYFNMSYGGIKQIKLIDPNGKQYITDVFGRFWCLAEDTKIMMVDWSERQIKDIQVGDRILGINPQTGQFQQDQVIIVSKHQDVYSESCDIWYFENGTIIKTPKQHRFFNINLNKFEYLNNWNVGDQIRLYDGSSAKLIKHQLVKQKTKCYTLFSKFNSYIANGAICGNRYSVNITPFDR